MISLDLESHLSPDDIILSGIHIKAKFLGEIHFINLLQIIDDPRNIHPFDHDLDQVLVSIGFGKRLEELNRPKEQMVQFLFGLLSESSLSIMDFLVIEY